MSQNTLDAILILSSLYDLVVLFSFVLPIPFLHLSSLRQFVPVLNFLIILLFCIHLQKTSKFLFSIRIKMRVMKSAAISQLICWTIIYLKTHFFFQESLLKNDEFFAIYNRPIKEYSRPARCNSGVIKSRTALNILNILS